jgi:hypothetical protein
VIRSGKKVAEVMTLAQARERAWDQLGKLPEEIKMFTSPSPYPVGLEGGLARRKEELIREVENRAGALRPQDRRRKL